jgi:NADPH:quinone reductase-like Zn-dependent oxidoreductase
MPRNLSFVQAAAVPLAAMTALQGLRDSGSLKPGMRVLVQGASGGVGGFALQLAKAFGAEVTAVCSSRNLSMAASLGADHVVDYGKEDFTRGGPRYDLVFAANGYHPVSAYLGALRPGGAYVVAGGTMRQLFEAMLGGRKKARVVSLAPRKPDLLLIRDLLEDGKLRPIIDDTYPLPRVAEAFRYFEAAHPKGKVAISVGAGEA